MNVYDEGYPIPVALSRITQGQDPRDVNLTSIGIKNSLNELQEAVNSALLTIDFIEVADTYVSLTDYKRGP